MLNEKMALSLKKFGRKDIFHYDNDPKHAAKITKI